MIGTVIYFTDQILLESTLRLHELRDVKVLLNGTRPDDENNALLCDFTDKK